MTVPGTMLAAVLHGREDVRMETVAVPNLACGEILVRVRAALTCGTDVKVFLRGYHAKMIAPPAIFGHEFAGDVVKTAADVADIRVGDRVVAANSAPCGECFFCLRQHPELCENLLFMNGAYAQYAVVPARIVRRNTLVIPDHVPYSHAALSEPLACVVRGFEDSGIRAGDTIAIVGDGQIALMFVRLAAAAGANVICVGRKSERLAVAERFGATVLIQSDLCDDVVGEVRRRSNDGRGPDVVVECVGRPHTWHQAAAMVRKAGTVNLFGGCPKDTHFSVDTARIHYDEITLMGSFHHTPAAFRTALRMISDGRVRPGHLIQDERPLSHLPAVLRSLAKGARPLKTCIVPP